MSIASQRRRGTFETIYGVPLSVRPREQRSFSEFLLPAGMYRQPAHCAASQRLERVVQPGGTAARCQYPRGDILSSRELPFKPGKAPLLMRWADSELSRIQGGAERRPNFDTIFGRPASGFKSQARIMLCRLPYAAKRSPELRPYTSPSGERSHHILPPTSVPSALALVPPPPRSFYLHSARVRRRPRPPSPSPFAFDLDHRFLDHRRRPRPSPSTAFDLDLDLSKTPATFMIPAFFFLFKSTHRAHLSPTLLNIASNTRTQHPDPFIRKQVTPFPASSFFLHPDLRDGETMPPLQPVISLQNLKEKRAVSKIPTDIEHSVYSQVDAS
ncbi:hypothetical protein DFH06DRAFT_1328615 [Mycena polygramma]|nr:hypothetical protein DFH06DRAFT_1328615 [Mycena polygramma]